MKFIVKLSLVCWIIFISGLPCFGARRALLVGISDYRALPDVVKGRMLSDLRGPINDVKAMEQALLAYGFKKSEIKVLKNQWATRERLEGSFRDWLTDGTGQGDTVVFYFSGHGTQVKDFNGDEKDGLDEVLCPYDTDPKTGNNTIVDDEFGSWLRRLHDRTVVVIVDSCYSGDAIRGIRGVTVSRLETVATTRIKNISFASYNPPPICRGLARGVTDVPPGVVFMGASMEWQPAFEIRRHGSFYGGFTFGLTAKMRELVNPTYGELFDRAKHMVMDGMRLPQTPVMFADARVAKRPAFGGKVYESPIPKPDIEKREKVLVAMEPGEGGGDQDFWAIRKALSRLDFVRLCQSSDFFDRLLQVEKKSDGFSAKLINRIGDVEYLNTSSVDDLIQKLKKRLEYAYTVKNLSRITNPRPPFRIHLWLQDEDRRDFWVGERIGFKVKSERDAYILIINVDTEGNFHIIFPNKYQKENLVRAGVIYSFPDPHACGFQIGEPVGEELVKVIATDRPLNLEALGPNNFESYFNEAGVISMPRGIGGTVLNNIGSTLSSGRFAWSEDSLVIRSHKQP